MNVAAAGISEVATAMGLDGEVLGTAKGPPPDLAGSYISLVSATNALQVGLVTTPEGCRKLAATLMGMDEDEAAELEDSDVADGVGELVNVLAGVMKTGVQEQDPDLRLGLPMFLLGEILPGNHTALDRVDCTLGGTTCSLVILLQKTSDAALQAPS